MPVIKSVNTLRIVKFIEKYFISNIILIKNGINTINIISKFIYFHFGFSLYLIV